MVKSGEKANSKSTTTHVYIAVMGITGAGKSSFIQLCTGQDAGIGEGLQSKTQDVREYCFTYKQRTVHLVDTPGFDDSGRHDYNVLSDVAGWLGVTYHKGIKLSGIIYLHRITDRRMQGSSLQSLSMFKKLCGEDFYKRVVLATTMWVEMYPPKRGAEREHELMSKPEYWGEMCSKGSKVLRHTDEHDTKSAYAILDTILLQGEGIAMKIQSEMEDGLKLQDTLAGQFLNDAILKEQEKHQQAMEKQEAEYKEALDNNDKRMAAEFERLREESEKKMKENEAAQADLRAADLAKLTEEREAKMKELEVELHDIQERYKKQEGEVNKLIQGSKKSDSDLLLAQQKLAEVSKEREIVAGEIKAKSSGVISSLALGTLGILGTVAKTGTQVAGTVLVEGVKVVGAVGVEVVKTVGSMVAQGILEELKKHPQ